MRPTIPFSSFRLRRASQYTLESVQVNSVLKAPLQSFPVRYLNFAKMMMSSDSHEMKDMASRICRDYLHGPWKKVNTQNIGFKHISGGLSNLLYHISLPDVVGEDEEKNQGAPKEVLLRVYGQIHGERALESLITESVIFTLLSERGLGPKLHGIFPGGRIEEFINARPLLTTELAEAKLSQQIAQKMAAIHTMEVPLHKEPRWLWDTIDRWLSSSAKIDPNTVPEFAKYLLNINLREEAKWLKERLTAEKSPVVFCHNDMQEGNILLIQDENENSDDEQKLVLIDFEYCSYNYRAFDIANHFLEWTYDYTEKDEPFFKALPENYPNIEQRLNFIKSYLHETGSKESPKTLLREVQVFSLASHFFWGIWSIINAISSKIPFGYWEYGMTRFNAYYKLKEEIPHLHGTKRKRIATD